VDFGRGVAIQDLLGDAERGLDRDGEAAAAPLPCGPVEAAVSTPTTCPDRSTSGPPESPATMLAWIWISPVS
jgi:hypothetical protein